MTLAISYLTLLAMDVTDAHVISKNMYSKPEKSQVTT